MSDLSAKSDSREDALAVVRVLRDAGHVAYFAGGCVRDALLGLTPKDYDVATDAPPDKVRALFRRTQAVGAAFGVILVRLKSSQIEVATFRKDLKYVDGRRPEGIVFATAEEDARRRDFTINGLFYDPVEDKVIDFVGGQEDLTSRTLRAIGNAEERFSEDYLRLLRAVRFAARFGLQIDAETSQAIRHNAEHLKRISPERIAEELRHMLTPATRVAAHRLLREFGLLDIILRFIPDARDPGHASVFQALARTTISFGVAMAAIILDAHGGVVQSDAQVRKSCAAVRQALKISNEETDAIEGALGFLSLVYRDAPLTTAALKRFLADRHSDDARVVMGAMGQVGIEYGRVQFVEEKLREVDHGEVAPPPLVTGDDLTAAGLRPGPTFKRALDAAYDAQLEGAISTKEQALEIAKRAASGSAAF